MRRAVVVGLVAGMLLPQSPAGAAVTCTRNSSSNNISINAAEGDTIDISRDALSLTVNGAHCTNGSALTTIDGVFLDIGISERSVNVIIRLSNGPFAPGVAEAGDSDEIEFIFGVLNRDDTLTVEGTASADSWSSARSGNVFGTNLNATEPGPDDLDLSLDDVAHPVLVFKGRGGGDSINANGGSWLGTTLGLTIDGGGGNDLLVGSRGPDTVVGGPGVDDILGHAGRDLIKGGGDRDYAEGNGGRDNLQGQGGRDELIGGGAGDTISGGPSKDRCVGGPAADAVNCEIEL